MTVTTIPRKPFEGDHDAYVRYINRVEPIKVEPNPSPGSPDATRATHPAFGQISASRVSGGTYLYDSDFHHDRYITITIRRSEMDRHLARDWHHAREELIEVKLSEAQWATFVSSMNVGMGTPCTIAHINRESVAGIQGVPQRHEQFSAEMKARTVDARKSLDELQAGLAAMGLSQKKLTELGRLVERARAQIGGSAEFIAQSFDEHMERTTEEAKIEVNAYATGMVQRAGLEALGVPIHFPEALPPAAPAPKESF
jgi:hypothetical protein